MKCTDVYELMQRDLDHDLSPAEQRVLVEHLAACPDCGRQYNQLKTISVHLDSLPQVNPPHHIVDRILPQIEQTNRDRQGQESESSDQETDWSKGSDQNQDHQVGLPLAKRFQQKKVWIPGVVAAAGLLLLFFINPFAQSPGSMDQAREEMAPMAETEHDGEASLMMNESQDVNDRAHREESVEQERAIMPDPVETEELMYPSPDERYVAHVGLGNEDIRIDVDGEPHYLSTWEAVWELETMHWVSDDELYYVLFHTEEEEESYRLINADERTTIELDQAYPIEE